LNTDRPRNPGRPSQCIESAEQDAVPAEIPHSRGIPFCYWRCPEHEGKLGGGCAFRRRSTQRMSVASSSRNSQVNSETSFKLSMEQQQAQQFVTKKAFRRMAKHCSSLRLSATSSALSTMYCTGSNGRSNTMAVTLGSAPPLCPQLYTARQGGPEPEPDSAAALAQSPAEESGRQSSLSDCDRRSNSSHPSAACSLSRVKVKSPSTSRQHSGGGGGMSDEEIHVGASALPPMAPRYRLRDVFLGGDIAAGDDDSDHQPRIRGRQQLVRIAALPVAAAASFSPGIARSASCF
uniref:Pecanex-like protein n=1 Tax=Macrostomum lignano TaxID=282301 RepID=A0A1I8FTF3_9PLAT